MNDPTLLSDLVRAGLSADLVNRVAEALLNVRDSPGHVRDIVRAYETGRRRKHRESVKKSSGKQTMSASSSATAVDPPVRDTEADGVVSSSFLSSSVTTELKGSKAVQASKRGTRIAAGTCMEREYFEFALAQGCHGDEAAKIWTEFVDYWSAIPGQRGLKLDWLATWRNRVRQVKARKGNGNGGSNEFDRRPGESLAQLGERMAERAREFEFENAAGRAHDDLGGH